MLKRLIIKRVILLIPMLIGITFISYSLMLLAPGDPTSMMIDPKISAEDLMRIKANMGLDKPVVVQYFIWLKNIVKGNLGYSYINGRPVLGLILERLPATLLLMFSSMILTVLLTTVLGVFSAVKNRSYFDNLVTIFTFTGMSIPTFWLALVMIMFLSLKLGWFPSSGMQDIMKGEQGVFLQIVDVMYHMTLPLLTMTIGSLAGLTKYMKVGMLKVLSLEYITAARSNGFSERKIIFGYALKNAVLPVITILGMSIPVLVGGSFIIEYIYAWPGMGRLGVDSIFMRDFPVIMGIILMSSILIILGNLAADIVYALVDPRIAFDRKNS